MEPAFSNLFSPIKIGKMTVRNRIAMPAMGTGFWSEDGLVTERAKAYYEARARGGVGMVILENTAIDFYQGMHASNRPTIDSDLSVPGLSEFTQAIKQHGAKAIVQLSHAGRMGKSKLGGLQPVAPSPVSLPGGKTPRPLSIEEIKEVIQLFVRAVVRARQAGFDGVELHAAHHYLLAHFLSPFFNRREDEYGGSLENRARILVEVLTAIRAQVGQDYPVWCRINAQEFGVATPFTLEESQAVVKKLRGLVDAVNVSVWGYGRDALVSHPDTLGGLLPFAAAIKKVAGVPVIAVGRLSPEVADEAIREGKTDIAGIGRGLIADSELPNKILSDRLSDIRPCITCFHCNDAGVTRNSALTCSVNGMAGREYELEIKPARVAKKIAVIGGGPAGMEAARVLSLRGHKVVLLEREGRLGGQLNLAMALPHKKARIGPLLKWFVHELGKSDVEVRLNSVAELNVIRRFKPDFVVLATGAVPVIPQFPGIEGSKVVTAFDVLAERAEVGQRVVILGGGSVGCETADFLHGRGKQVTVVEMQPELAADLGVRDRLRLLNRITTLPITVLTGTTCRGLAGDGAAVSNRDKDWTVTADTFVLALGTRPDNALYPVLRAAGVETRLIGDCWHGGKIVQAVSDGLRVGLTL